MSAARVKLPVMDPDELFAPKPQDPVTQLCREDLDRLSVAELKERIAALSGEIERVRAKLSGAVTHRTQAETLFKR